MNNPNYYLDQLSKLDELQKHSNYKITDLYDDWYNLDTTKDTFSEKNIKAIPMIGSKWLGDYNLHDEDKINEIKAHNEPILKAIEDNDNATVQRVADRYKNWVKEPAPQLTIEESEDLIDGWAKQSHYKMSYGDFIQLCKEEGVHYNNEPKYKNSCPTLRDYWGFYLKQLEKYSQKNKD